MKQIRPELNRTRQGLAVWRCLKPTVSFIVVQYHHQSPGLPTKLHHYRPRLIHNFPSQAESVAGKEGRRGGGGLETDAMAGRGLYFPNAVLGVAVSIQGLREYFHSYRAYSFSTAPAAEMTKKRGWSNPANSSGKAGSKGL